MTQSIYILLHMVEAEISCNQSGELVLGWQNRPGRHLTWLFARSEEHTSELQSHSDLVCRLLLEKKKKQFKKKKKKKTDQKETVIVDSPRCNNDTHDH